MNPGAVEEGGKVASTLIEGLKAQPIVLALVVFNLAFLILVHFNGRDLRQHQEFQFKLLVENQAKLQELLAHCTPDPK